MDGSTGRNALVKVPRSFPHYVGLACACAPELPHRSPEADTRLCAQEDHPLEPRSHNNLHSAPMFFASLLPSRYLKRFDPALQHLNSLCLSPIRLRQLFRKIHEPFEGNG